MENRSANGLHDEEPEQKPSQTEEEEVPNLDEEEDEPEIVTMLDVLKEETELEENAEAVLGNSDDTKCTITAGSLKRQAIYACKTCADSSGVSAAGICLACSLHCHDGHDLYELYTKRSFRCDCGDPARFPDKKCSLEPDVERKNVSNSYNQNFDGKYCTCHRPYPDPEDEVEDSMIQCIVCEDWFHARHLAGHVPDDEDFSEMICQQCMSSLSFLWAYYDQPTCKRIRLSIGTSKNDADVTADENVQQNGDADVKLQQNGDADEKKPICELKIRREKKNSESGTGATFWPEEWRSSLCKCDDCMQMYAEKKCAFLLDNEDTVHFYEEEGRKRTRSASASSTSSMERGLEAFGQMPHMQRIEMLHGYNDLKTALQDYLKEFADKNEVVTKEHISEFFEQFRRSRAASFNPHVFDNCR